MTSLMAICGSSTVELAGVGVPVVQELAHVFLFQLDHVRVEVRDDLCAVVDELVVHHPVACLEMAVHEPVQVYVDAALFLSWDVK